MCAIFGFLDKDLKTDSRQEILDRMYDRLRHRGPDAYGSESLGPLSLGHARLSLLGVSNGKQPLSGRNERVRCSVAGEIFNYVELKEELAAKGHVFKTLSDSEVVPHLYEEYGINFISKLNGQFAIALWDGDKQELYLIRDRFGILPLFYWHSSEQLVFASEIKAILEFPGVPAELDARALEELFRFWTTVPPMTMFKGIREVLPGHYLCWKGGCIEEHEYWTMNFTEQRRGTSESKISADIYDLLEDATRVRLRADKPVGAYVSGGVDSSILTAMAAQQNPQLQTFSIGFRDAGYDETEAQNFLIAALGLKNNYVLYDPKEGMQELARMVWHAEKPFLRSAPAAMYFLSRTANRTGYKAVLAGEGADEFFVGYDLFKEAKIRLFWAANKKSQKRPSLLNRLYPDQPFVRSGDNRYLQHFFGIGDSSDPFFSHRPRWNAMDRLKIFFSEDLRRASESHFSGISRDLPEGYDNWHAISKAQYLEASFFLSGYLLSTQGDRMAMAHSVEVRYPYLDHRLVEYCNTLPPSFKMRGLAEKGLLRKAAAGRLSLPAAVLQRRKKAFRAPGFSKEIGLVREVLNSTQLTKSGYFDAAMVEKLLKKAETSELHETDEMALCGILTTQIFYDNFVSESVHG